MSLLERPGRKLGSSDLRLGPLGFGCVPLGNLYTSISASQALETVTAARNSGIDYFDTAPFYGFGLSERRLGVALGAEEEVMISTKVGRTLFPAKGRPVDHGIFREAPPFGAAFDFTHDGVMRQVEDSLQRLGRDRVDCLVIHDLGLWHMETTDVLEGHYKDLAGGGLRALEKLRAEGTVRAVGAGANELTLCNRFIERPEIDFILLALRFTLLDQSAFPELMNDAARTQTGIIVGAPFQSGILATGTSGDTLNANYGDADGETIVRVRRIEAICATHSVPLPAAALQFPLLHPAVASVLAGMRSVNEVAANAAAMLCPIPPQFWSDLQAEGLIPAALDCGAAPQ
ncbi:MAG: aldo/keto reductase [Hyphomonas sp.]|nr:aldo/keto reductase [Hyphomonas sp.]